MNSGKVSTKQWGYFPLRTPQQILLLSHMFAYSTMVMVLVIFIPTLGRMFYQLYLLVKIGSGVCVRWGR